MKKLIPVLLSGIIFLQSFGQGTIRGTVIDDETGEVLIGANVVISGTTKGDMTDLDGKFSIEDVDPGMYNLTGSYISYEKKIIEGVEVKDGEVTIVDFRLGTTSLELDNVVIEAKAVRNTESALLTIQKKSANVLDGVSAQAFAKTGDSDAAEAIKRVTGVSVEGGRYVYVRGLGDRYTKTLLNAMEIPGLDPDRNTVQMDIFPSNLINNLIVYKTFSPDLPGDFTGGMVNIETKDFPDRKTISAGASWSYNPDMHFNDKFILYDRQPLDPIGLGKINRQQPFNATNRIPDPVEGDPTLTKLTNSFAKQMAVENKNNFLDQKYSFAIGNQMNRGERTLGYNLSLNYENEYEFYEQVEYGEYQKSSNPSVYELNPLKKSTGTLGMHDVLWSAMLGGAIKRDNNKISANFLHIQNGTSRAAKLGVTDFFNSAKLVKDNLEYTQRSISNFLLSGKHQINKFQLTWKNAATYSSMDDPDVRSTAFSVTSGDTTLNSGDGAQVNRIWRDLDEVDNSTRMDVSFPFDQWKGLESKLTFGVSNVFKKRYYDIINYRFQVRGISTFNGDPDWLFSDDHIWVPESGNGTYVTGNIEPANSYEAISNVLAVYAMNELPLHEKVKMIYGLRMEKANTLYTGQNNSGSIDFVNESVLDELDFLPTANLVYEVIKNMNLRGSFSMTVARPSFRENSIAQIYDPIQDRTYIGGLSNGQGLKETKIRNMDVRWEYFFNREEMVSLSGFYKKFKDPIEIVAYETNPDNVQPRNVGDGTVYGVEVELRKNLAFIHEKLEGLLIGSNVTYVHSAIEMSDEEFTGSTGTGGRVGNAREGEEVSRTRVMLGQSPYIINAFIGYSSYEVGLDINISYNIQGKRLSVVGSGRIPDVYEMPFHSLNFKISQKLGKEKRFKVSFSAENLLGDDKQWVYQSFKATDRNYERYDPGRKFSAGVAYEFNK